MILHRQLNDDEMRLSRRFYLIYNLINGFSYMCLGETVILLLAVNLGCSDTVVAILGSMLFWGFLLLPLGKIMTARCGAAASQANFWVLRNLAALLVAGAAPAALFFSPQAAAVLLITGSFLFYGFRAAGVVMSQPLVGEICPSDEQGRFVFRSWCCFYCCGLLALIVISTLLRYNSSTWMLFAVVVTGTVAGLISSSFVRRIRESGEIMVSARQSLKTAIKEAMHNKDVVRQMIAGMCCNTATIMLAPISMLAVKRGYGVSDSSALLCSLVQYLGSIFICVDLGKMADRFGSRKIVLSSFYMLYLIPLFWLLAPGKCYWFVIWLPFILSPCGLVACSVGLQQYFLRSVPKNQQIAASMVISVATGVASGLLGSVLSTLFLKAATLLNNSGEVLTVYRIYFAGVLILLPVLSIFIHRLRSFEINSK